MRRIDRKGKRKIKDPGSRGGTRFDDDVRRKRFSGEQEKKESEEKG